MYTNTLYMYMLKKLLKKLLQLYFVQSCRKKRALSFILKQKLIKFF